MSYQNPSSNCLENNEYTFKIFNIINKLKKNVRLFVKLIILYQIRFGHEVTVPQIVGLAFNFEMS